MWYSLFRLEHYTRIEITPGYNPIKFILAESQNIYFQIAMILQYIYDNFIVYIVHLSS